MDDLKPIWADAPRRCPELVLPVVRFIPGHRPRPIESHTGFDAGVDLYHQGYLWEAHEAWEAEFKGPDRVFVQGLIQLAAMLLKSHLGNEAGVSKLYAKSRANLAQVAECRDIDAANLVAQLDRFFATRDWADAPRLVRIEDRAQPARDGGLRLFGMVVGAGVGALALIIPSRGWRARADHPEQLRRHGRISVPGSSRHRPRGRSGGVLARSASRLGNRGRGRRHGLERFLGLVAISESVQPRRDSHRVAVHLRRRDQSRAGHVGRRVRRVRVEEVAAPASGPGRGERALGLG
jgi:hypothetical protein